ncbi:hypothetical protein FKW31_03640 [Acetobacter sp. DmW_136]|uniref:hypothetical protein n=1 Tax=Acetobacter sp. DmW_136 TaxID=2591091 RepID=UPI001239F9F9|nr:hypothetical protein [Acetobacter sp. DmW_136]KAA8387741.1 hypothetical protein FKW31_03640 [Acetobacter sp. DmW_136]
MMADANTCPVKCIGTSEGDGGRYYIFRDVAGQERKLTRMQLTRRPDLVALFGGNISWLKSHFPHHTNVMKSHPDGSISRHRMVLDFVISDAADWLMSECLSKPMPAPSNIRIPNQDSYLQDLIAQFLHQADLMDGISLDLRAELFMPAATAFANIATCMREQTDELKKHLKHTILAEDHTP